MFSPTDGFQTASLVVDSHGNLFGTTSGDSMTSLGEVFMVPAGTTNLTVIQSYSAGSSDNVQPAHARG